MISDKTLKILIDVRKISDKEMEEMRLMAENQQNHVHPLKHVKQRKINALGDYNMQVYSQLKALKGTLKNNPFAQKQK